MVVGLTVMSIAAASAATAPGAGAAAAAQLVRIGRQHLLQLVPQHPGQPPLLAMLQQVLQQTKLCCQQAGSPPGWMSRGAACWESGGLLVRPRYSGMSNALVQQRCCKVGWWHKTETMPRTCTMSSSALRAFNGCREQRVATATMPPAEAPAQQFRHVEVTV